VCRAAAVDHQYLAAAIEEAAESTEQARSARLRCAPNWACYQARSRHRHPLAPADPIHNRDDEARAASPRLASAVAALFDGGGPYI
jgi:hypothetical protein